uniref:Uncharacterized protein n=1 Tax=Panagrolaimus sp. ES5 TaxID=591445 RepID=A0AC34FJZ9_9BILA
MENPTETRKFIWRIYDHLIVQQPNTRNDFARQLYDVLVQQDPNFTFDESVHLFFQLPNGPPPQQHQ